MAEFDPKNCPVGAVMAARIESMERLIEQSLKALSSEVGTLRNSVDKDMTEIKRTLEHQNKALFGNGGVGIRGDLETYKDRLVRLEANAKKSDDIANSWRLQRWGWAVAIGIAVFSAIIQIIL